MDATKGQGTAEQMGSTARRDAWWIEPMLVAVGFGLFIIYATWRAFEGNYFDVSGYLSPFYSPRIALSFWPWSPAILILWIPALFRATCYYYRKAYYRAYFLDPPGCGVGHFGGKKYCGESNFPLVMQNLHRYMLYLAIVVLAFLWYDCIVSFFYQGGFRVAAGSLIMLANVVLLTNYTCGCHALRHIVGGSLDCFSCTKGTQAQHGIWTFVSKLNEHHMLWAWLSLFSVGFTDFYIRSVASGAITDIRFF